jgi:hypothetical protein
MGDASLLLKHYPWKPSHNKIFINLGLIKPGIISTNALCQKFFDVAGNAT